MFALTEKQKRLYDWLRERNNQVGPSYEEMRVAMDINSKSGVHRLIHGLKERGAIDFLPGKRRSVKVNDE